MKKETKKKIIAAAMSGVMALGMGIVPGATAKAATEHWNDASAQWTQYKADWSDISSNYENVSLTPGVNETQLNFAWYSHTEEIPKVRMAQNKDMKEVIEFEGKQTDIGQTEIGRAHV